MEGLTKQKTTEFRDYLKDYFKAMLKINEIFATWLSQNLNHLNDTSAALLETLDNESLDAVRCSTVCQLNSATEMKIFKLVVKGMSVLTHQRRNVFEEAIRKT